MLERARRGCARIVVDGYPTVGGMDGGRLLQDVGRYEILHLEIAISGLQHMRLVALRRA